MRINRRTFLKVSGMGAMTLFLSGCGLSAQLKTIIDRFYSRTTKLNGKKSILMATAYNSADWTMEALVTHYNTLVRYMNWQDAGQVLAIGCGSRPLVEHSAFGEQAYQIGANL